MQVLVCVCVCVCVCACVCVWCIYVCSHVYAYIHSRTFMYMHTLITNIHGDAVCFMFTREKKFFNSLGYQTLKGELKHIHTHMHTYILNCMHACMHTYIRICIYIHACMHAYVHTYAHSWRCVCGCVWRGGGWGGQGRGGELLSSWFTETKSTVCVKVREQTEQTTVRDIDR